MSMHHRLFSSMDATRPIEGAVASRTLISGEPPLASVLPLLPHLQPAPLLLSVIHSIGSRMEPRGGITTPLRLRLRNEREARRRAELRNGVCFPSEPRAVEHPGCGGKD